MLNLLLIKLFRCKTFKTYHKTISTHFEFPIRIKAAGIVAFGLCLTTDIAIIVAASYMKEVIDSLQNNLDYLRGLPGDEVFLFMNLQSSYVITVSSGISLVEFFIEVFTPIFPCVTVAMTGGFCLSCASIYNLFYMYKKMVLTIRSEGENSELLMHAWSFGTHTSIFFCAQFIINAFFLGYLFAFGLFLTCYLLSFKETFVILWNFVKSREPLFWVGLIPVILGYFLCRSVYFPQLVDKHKFVKNKTYFSFWDTWYFLIGGIGAALKALTRYFIAIAAIFILGYRVNRSIMPHPLDKLDALYCGFHASVALHCMKEGIIPSSIRSQLTTSSPLLENIN